MHSLKDGTKTLFLFLIFTIIAYIFYHITQNTTNIDTIYILCVLLVARFTSGYFWGILAALCGVMGVNYFFTYPFFEFNFTLSGYPITFLGMLMISIITSTLTAHVKEQCRMTATKEGYLNQLNEINTKLIMADSSSQIIGLALYYVMQSTKSSCIFYTDDPLHDQMPYTNLVDTQDASVFSLGTERILAHQAYTTHKITKSSIPESSDSPYSHENYPPTCTYFPIISRDQIWGVLGLYNEGNPSINDDSFSLLKLILPQIALALESQSLVDSHQQLAIETEKEKMRANLLRAISHDLRTPLTGIIGASATYLENTNSLEETEKYDLISHINEDANWLLHMVENLLSITRISNGTTKVNKKAEPLEEVISESVSRIKKRYHFIKLNVSIPDEFIMVPMDATLIEQVIINLLENAILHSKTTDSIELIATLEPHCIKIQVTDHGVGISEQRLATLFDGYSTSTNQSSDTSKGMGIGLSICKTIILAHSGHIWAQNLKQGTSFIFTLPLEGADNYE